MKPNKVVLRRLQVDKTQQVDLHTTDRRSVFKEVMKGAK